MSIDGLSHVLKSAALPVCFALLMGCHEEGEQAEASTATQEQETRPAEASEAKSEVNSELAPELDTYVDDVRFSKTLVEGGQQAFVDGLRTIQAAGGFKVGVLTRKWVHTAVYPGADGQLWTSDDLREERRITLPVGQAVVIELRSEDVIHGFFIPTLRIKKDSVPGRVNQVAMPLGDAGTYDFFCTEYSGLNHSQMTGVLHVVELDAFGQHLASLTQVDDGESSEK